MARGVARSCVRSVVRSVPHDVPASGEVTEFIVNGDFATADGGGWANWQSDATWNSNAIPGRAVGVNGETPLEQDFGPLTAPLTASGSYTVSFDVITNANSDVIRVALGMTEPEQNIAAGGAPGSVSQGFTADDNWTTIFITNESNTNFIVVDNVSIIEA